MLTKNLTSTERTVLCYLIDALDMAPQKAKRLIEICKPDETSTAAFCDIVEKLKTAASSDDEAKNVLQRANEIREMLR